MSPATGETTIRSEDRSAIKAALGSQVEIVACTAARVYCTGLRPDRWSAQGHEGALALLKDRTLGGLFFRLVEMNSCKVVWEHEVYFDFEYRIDCDFFHSFDSDNGLQIGFLFASEQEANDFAQVVYQKSEILQISSSAAPSTAASSRRPSKREGSIKSMETAESGGGFFASLFRRRKDKKPSSSTTTTLAELTAKDIGDPTDFQHLAHIGFNAQTGAFDVQNIPTEWKSIFQKAGVTREQLENKETAGFIADFVKNAGGGKSAGLVDGSSVSRPAHTSAAARKTKGPPPPPPAKSFTKGPPPPPPSRSPRPMAQPVLRVPSPQKVNEDATSSDAQTQIKDGPRLDASRAQLLASIRSADQNKILKPVERTNSTGSIASASSLTPSGGTSEDQSDIMASMLAKALATRNKKLAHSDSSDNDNGNDEW